MLARYMLWPCVRLSVCVCVCIIDFETIDFIVHTAKYCYLIVVISERSWQIAIQISVSIKVRTVLVVLHGSSGNVDHYSAEVGVQLIDVVDGADVHRARLGVDRQPTQGCDG